MFLVTLIRLKKLEVCCVAKDGCELLAYQLDILFAKHVTERLVGRGDFVVKVNRQNTVAEILQHCFKFDPPNGCQVEFVADPVVTDTVTFDSVVTDTVIADTAIIDDGPAIFRTVTPRSHH